jgi:hypothetical protein
MKHMGFGQTAQGLIILVVAVGTAVIGSLGLLIYQTLKAFGIV